MCVILPNKWVNFIFLHKFCKETRCFLEKFTQQEIFLHNHRSWWSWQISSLGYPWHSSSDQLYVSSEMTFMFYFELWSVSCDGADFLSHYFSPKKCNACLKFCTLSAQLHPIFTWVTFFYSGSPTHLLLEHPTCQSGNMTSLFLQRFVVTAPSLMPIFDPDCIGRPWVLELHMTRNPGQDVQTLDQGVRRSKWIESK